MKGHQDSKYSDSKEDANEPPNIKWSKTCQIGKTQRKLTHKT